MRIFQKTLLLSVILLFTFSFNGCKKYEDGPGISFRPKVFRLAGVWKVEELQDAFASDILNTHISNVNSGSTTEVIENRSITIEIEKNGGYLMKVIAKNTTTVTDNGGNVTSSSSENSTDFDEGSWVFSEDKESIDFMPNDPYNTYLTEILDIGGFINNVGVKISRLTKKEFNFSDDYGNIWKLKKQ